VTRTGLVVCMSNGMRYEVDYFTVKGGSTELLTVTTSLCHFQCSFFVISVDLLGVDLYF
jgi:hypothetical protein